MENVSQMAGYLQTHQDMSITHVQLFVCQPYTSIKKKKKKQELSSFL